MAIDTKTISGWIIVILIAAFSGVITGTARNSDLEKDNREYRIRLNALEKNQDAILKTVTNTNDAVVEIKTFLKIKNEYEKDPNSITYSLEH